MYMQYSLLTGDDPSLDIQPTSDVLIFTTGVASRSFTLSVLPDDISEVNEVCDSRCGI